ncbi:hypothetical protein [Duodenibacillus massiliensis]|jgi:hypothetical protein|uniref:hypothetical protein n=1 Tax=Duodenibacillus massiliensis TaxID=1852381 RepID=UPI002FDAF92F
MSQTLINVSAAKAAALSEFLGAINEAAAKNSSDFYSKFGSAQLPALGVEQKCEITAACFRLLRSVLTDEKAREDFPALAGWVNEALADRIDDIVLSQLHSAPDYPEVI